MKLLVFPHSHFCEKARFALDYKGIAYKLVVVVPGLHLLTIPKLAPNSSVPVLIDGGTTVQNADQIIDYLEAKCPQPTLSVATLADAEHARKLELDMDQRIGANLRQILYARLLDYPQYLRHCFTCGMPWHKRLAFLAVASKLRRRIHAGYVKSDTAVAAAREEFDVAMAELETRLNGEPYLFGEQFSRADLSIATMLSLLALPPEHPFPYGDIPDPKLRIFYDEHRDHPVCNWAQEIYRKHR